MRVLALVLAVAVLIAGFNCFDGARAADDKASGLAPVFRPGAQLEAYYAVDASGFWCEVREVRGDWVLLRMNEHSRIARIQAKEMRDYWVQPAGLGCAWRVWPGTEGK